MTTGHMVWLFILFLVFTAVLHYWGTLIGLILGFGIGLYIGMIKTLEIVEEEA